jgi:hypothetical protein
MNQLLTFVLTRALGLLGTFLASVVKSYLSDKDKGGMGLLDELARVTKHIVSDLDFEDLTNDAKRKRAIKLVKQEAKRLGQDVSDNLAAILVESAVGAIKAELE